MGLPLPPVPEARPGMVLRNLFMEFLWYCSCNREMRRTTHPPFWNLVGPDVRYQTMRWDDPLPVVGFVGASLAKYMNPKALRDKLGNR